jgi:hypothetical protein
MQAAPSGSHTALPPEQPPPPPVVLGSGGGTGAPSLPRPPAAAATRHPSASPPPAAAAARLPAGGATCATAPPRGFQRAPSPLWHTTTDLRAVHLRPTEGGASLLQPIAAATPLHRGCASLRWPWLRAALASPRCTLRRRGGGLWRRTLAAARKAACAALTASLHAASLAK